MLQRNSTTIWIGILGMFLLITDSRTAIESVSGAIDLCIQSLIPAIFPFLICSMVLTGSLGTSSLPLLWPLESLVRIPEGSGIFLLMGYLGGYPVGAQNVSLAYSRGQLSKEDASRMIPFCNNAGPSFIFGVLGGLLGTMRDCWFLWLIHILASLISAMMMPGTPGKFRNTRESKPLSLSKILSKSIATMANICGWVILFRLLLAYLEKLIMGVLPLSLRVLFSGILELANGCIFLNQLNDPCLRFILASGMLGFGGLCVALQTKSLCSDLSLRLYFPGKILHGCVSMIHSYFYCYLTYKKTVPLPWLILPVMIILPVISLLWTKNSSSIPAPSGV